MKRFFAHSRRNRLAVTTALVAVVALAIVIASCSSDDDGAEVRALNSGSESISASASGSASGSASASASGSASGSASASASTPGSATASASASGTEEASTDHGADGGYEYASNVDAHRRVVADICGIGDLLDAADFQAVADIYRNGGNSVNSDGSIRTIAGFASRDDRQHGLDAYYGTPGVLDEFVTNALEGTGIFAGQSNAVRAQGTEKGIQNQVMVAWVVHELNTALDKASNGDFNVDSGAVHNWDEAWAFYHGIEPGCAPYATANKRAANFATTGSDGETALANEAILAAMIAGRDALLDSDAAAAADAADQALRNVAITYSQAAIRYASLIEGDLADGNDAKAKEHQAEGLAFWRVVEAYLVPVGADAEAMNAIFDLSNPPGVNGFGDAVRAALEPSWAELGITEGDIGILQ